MQALVHGVDLVEIQRITHMLESHGDRFLDRVFTAEERAYAAAGGAGMAERYAARFAAKEAVFKAVGTGWAGGTAWTDVGVVNRTGGAPTLVVTGHTAEVAQAQGIREWTLSLSHAGGMAIASVIGILQREC